MNFILPCSKRLTPDFTVICVVLMWILNGCGSTQQSRLHDITGHLPNLNFSLTSDTHLPVTNETVEDNLVMLFFGFSHCRAECPTTIFRLSKIVKGLGDNAKQIRILFVTLDPARDTPEVLHRYLKAFNIEQAIGLTGNENDIKDLAKRYRIASQFNATEAEEIIHSTVIYVFDKEGRARRVITPDDSVETITNDLNKLLESDH